MILPQLKKTQKKLLIASIVAITATLSVVFVNSKAYNVQKHNEEIQVFRDIRLLNALSNQELLRIRYQLFTSFDLLSQHTLKLRNINENVGRFELKDHDLGKVQQLLTSLQTNLQDKVKFTDEFKTANALLKNSLVVFPNLNNELQTKLLAYDNVQHIASLSDSIVRDIYLYSMINDDQLDNQMLHKVEKLKDMQFNVEPEIMPYLHIIYKHARTIIDNRQQVNQLINILLEMPIEKYTEQLQSLFTDDHSAMLDQSNFYRSLLYVLSIMLLSYTALILIKLRRKSHELEQEKNHAFVTLHSIGDGIITTDAAGIIKYMNPVAEQLTGWRNDAAQAKDLEKVFQLYDERTSTPVTGLVERCIFEKDKVRSASHSVLINSNGTKTAIEDTVTPIRGIDNEIIGTIIVFRDVSHTRELSRKLSYQASHDALTNVINRRAFEIRVTEAIHRAKSNGEQHALLYLDLDQFKIVNDTCGHDAGDELLIQVTSLLQKKLGKGDTLARLGGDEFGILLQKTTLPKAREFAEEILVAVKHFRFEWHSIHFQLGVSIGVAMINRLTQNVAAALSAADMACYVSKDTGRNRVHIYSQGNKELIRRKDEMQWVSRLTTAFKENRFILYRQPIVPICPEDNRVHRYELLLRLSEQDGTLIQPSEFIPAAERYNFMPTLDRWVIRTAFACLSQSRIQESYSINLSGTSLNSNTLLRYIKQELSKYKINPANVCFEITETAAINNLAKTARLIKEMKKMGFRFALDDFGKGLSSFMYLSSLPVDYLKIDGEFVRNLTNNTINHAIIWSINNIGHILGMQIIAEYVENEELHNALNDMGIDFAQGYKFGTPEPLYADWLVGEKKTIAKQTAV